MVNLPDVSAFQNKGSKDPLVEPQLFFVLMILLLCLKHMELHGETPRPKRLSEQRMQDPLVKPQLFVAFITY